jgi:hypothetical protein
VVNAQIPPLSGEFHFWRHPRLFWDRILDGMSEIGISVVATFFCWEFHEIERGVFDLTGETAAERNIDEFMRLCAERDLLVFARPGPIIDSEWPSRGPSSDIATLERTDPVFIERARVWTRAISAKLAQHQQPHGPVAYVQIDNEVFYPHFTEVSATEADSAIHIPFHADRVLSDLRRWKQRRDGLAVELAAALETFPEQPAPAFAELSLAHRLLALDFINSVIEDYLAWVRDEMRTAGLTVPITTNIKQSCSYLDAARFEDTIDRVGYNYYLEHYDSPAHFRVGLWWGELARTQLREAWAPEFWCGRWVEEDADPSMFKEDHYRFVLLTTLAVGFRALNLFMAVDRDDWHYAALTGLGKPRAAARTISSVAPVLDALEPDERLSDVGIVWTTEHHAEYIAQSFADWREPSSIWTDQTQAKELDPWWSTFAALVDRDHDVRLLTDERALLDAPLVVYAGPAWAPEWVARSLLTRLEAGRPVIFTGALPTNDLSGARLADADRLATLAETAVSVAPESAPAAVEALGIDDWVRASDLVTTAFERADGTVWMFLINPHPHESRSSIALRDELAGRAQRSIWGEASLVGDSVVLPARSVAIIELSA